MEPSKKIDTLKIAEDLQKHIPEEEIRFLQTLLDTIPLPVFYKGVDGRYIGCNKAFEEFVGKPQEEIIGKTVYDMGPKDIADTYNEKDRELFENPGKQCYEWVVKNSDGEIRDVIFCKATYCDDHGNVKGLIGVITDITERKRVELNLNRLSTTDDLTGLYNRRGFFLMAEQQLRTSNREKEGRFLLFADFNYLKSINDTFGHTTGDRALIDAANILKESFREPDIIARIGGDEFVILGKETHEANITTLTTRLKMNLDAYNSQSDNGYKISLSTGLARYDPQHPRSIDELLSEADTSMYVNKKKRQQE